MDTLAYPRIGGPAEAHNAGTEQKYRMIQMEQLNKLKSALQFRPWPEVPWLFTGDPLTAEINSGRWIVRCDCGNGPSASPEWKLALCLDCFAVYENVIFPNYEDRLIIESALLQRQKMCNRNWTTIETVEDLLAENEEHLSENGAE